MTEGAGLANNSVDAEAALVQSHRCVVAVRSSWSAERPD